jgi:hypothetical protein
MQEGEAADGVATTITINNDIAITATGMGCPVSPIQQSPPPRCASPKGNKLTTCESSAVLKDNMLVRFMIIVGKRRFPPERLCPVSDLNDHPASERV